MAIGAIVRMLRYEALAQRHPEGIHSDDTMALSESA